MIGKLIKGSSMRGLLDYLLAAKDQRKQRRPRVKIVGGIFAGTTPREIASEFGVLRALRPNLNVAVVHESLRLPPDASEPTDDVWCAIARHWAQAMGFDCWVAISHGDGHIHIAASRILVDGSVVSDKHDWTLSERVVREVERTFGLEEIEPSHLLNHANGWIQQKAPSKGQSAVAEKTGLPLPSEIAAGVIDGLLTNPISASDFVTGLQAAGIDVRPNIASTAKVSGLAYSLGGVPVTAKAMGRAYTWSQLQQRGLQYDEARDLPTLRKAYESSILAQASLQSAAGEFDYVTKVDRSPAQSAAHAFAAVAIARFMEAAGTDQFMVFHEPGALSGVGFKEISDLMHPAMLDKMLSGGLLNSSVRAEVLDPRIVVISDLGQSQLAELSNHGLQPFAVTEIASSIFEACIRLVPASEPEPSLKVRNEAAAIITRTVGGRVTEAVLLPGFVNPKMRLRRGRRVIAMLRQVANVVAVRGAALLAYARRRLNELSGNQASVDDVTPLHGLAKVDSHSVNSASTPNDLSAGEGASSSLEVVETYVHSEFGISSP